jgi:hypothetical protein
MYFGQRHKKVILLCPKKGKDLQTLLKKTMCYKISSTEIPWQERETKTSHTQLHTFGKYISIYLASEGGRTSINK